MELEPAAIEAVLERWPVARLATHSRAGRAALVPIVFARAGGALWSPVDGKPKRGGELARVRNLRTDPRVELLLDHYAEDWELLWWLRVEGRASAERVDSAARAPAHAAALAALAAKYPQYARVPLLGPEALLLRIEPQRFASWRASARAAP